MLSRNLNSSTTHTSFQSSHARWLALTQRNPSSHSSFLYGVKSTKIYCRPTCSARVARRANVVFYDTEEQARCDGYRPCKRCKPDDDTFVGEAEAVATRMIAFLREKKDDSMLKQNTEELAREVGVTRSYLCRVFKKTMGVTVGAYVKEFEMEANQNEIEGSLQVRSKVVPGLVDVGMGPLTQATISGNPSALEDGRKKGLAEGNAENLEELVDWDLDVNFDEWLWTDLPERMVASMEEL